MASSSDAWLMSSAPLGLQYVASAVYLPAPKTRTGMGCSSGAELEAGAEVKCDEDESVLLGGAPALGCVGLSTLVEITAAALGGTRGGEAGCCTLSSSSVV